jgi:anti-sigma B factor antagonist
VLQPESLGVAVVEIGDAHIVRLSGELDVGSADDLTERLAEIGGSNVVVDLADLSFMDSSGIGALIRAKNRMAADGNSLVLSRPQPNVLRVLEITGLADWVVGWSPEWSDQPDLGTP